MKKIKRILKTNEFDFEVGDEIENLKVTEIIDKSIINENFVFQWFQIFSDENLIIEIKGMPAIIEY